MATNLGDAPIGGSEVIEQPIYTPPIAKVSAALVKAQKEFKPASKSGNNPHLRSKYAKLEDVIAAVKDGLSNNGLAFTQTSHIENGLLILTTRLIHESGEVLYSNISIPITKADAQGIGSTLQYCRRYSLSSLLGVSTGELDDDGQSTVTATDKAIANAKALKNKKEQQGLSDGIL